MTSPSRFAGRYRIVRRLGAGGTAAVYLAEDERLGRQVAVKRLHGAEVTEETAERLRREARIMASLRHPNLVKVFDMLIEGEDVLLVMEYVPGETLGDVVRAGPLAPRRAIALLEPVAAALDHAHEHGVVHRDVKPSNILVGASGVVKLADLGLATAAEITRITPPGSILGTPAYMAPEQAQPVPPAPPIDVYALAVVAFQALSGTLPRRGRTALEILQRAAREPPPDLRDALPGAPAAAAAALRRGLAADPAARPTSASELIGALDDAFPAREARALQPPPARPRVGGRGARIAALGALVAALAAVAVVVVLGARGTSSPGTASTARPAATRTPAATPTGTRTATPTATPAARSAQATATTTPSRGARTSSRRRRLSATDAVRAFYTRAAAGDFAGAWSLAGPRMRAAFGNSAATFERDLSSLRRVTFRRLAIASRSSGRATVTVETVALHTNRTDHCTGTLAAVQDAGGRWLVEPAGLQCRSG